jgi:hypothetical protein
VRGDAYHTLGEVRRPRDGAWGSRREAISTLALHGGLAQAALTASQPGELRKTEVQLRRIYLPRR